MITYNFKVTLKDNTTLEINATHVSLTDNNEYTFHLAEKPYKIMPYDDVQYMSVDIERLNQ